jgi:putative methylase
MRLRQLEMALQGLGGYERPKANLEQYQTPAPLAARLLFHARMRGDIEGKRVCDPGCGTGILAIGAALLGAEKVIGIEIDAGALDSARRNADKAGVDVEFIQADIRTSSLHETIVALDTVIMNPPFGAQKVHADRPFIDFAIAAAPVTYGIFNAGTIPFLEAYTSGRARIDERVGGSFPIRRTFSFHTKDVQVIEVEIVRLIQTESPKTQAHRGP